MIIAIGLTAALGLVVSAINLQSLSRDTNIANGLVKAKIEELSNYAPTAVERTRGGSLTTDVANYNDASDPRFRRRWLIEEYPTDAGVPMGTQRITITILPNRPDIEIFDVQVQILLPKS